MSKLRVGPDLTLPDDAVTQTFVVFGKRGSGKSNTAVVLAEEMHRAGGQIVVLDPVGAWWGLKSSFDGTGPGLPVYIFGGTHGDLPLQPTAGQLMAQVAIAHRIPMVLDLSGWSGADRARFVTSFATWLLAHNDRTPMHVFLEEADAFIPQRPYKGEEAMLGAMDRLIRWGRQEGIGATAITQRSAKINKDVTTQAEVLIAHRTIGPQDVAAIREWIKYHAAGDEQQEVLSSLPTLPDGTAWVWSPDWLDLLRQVPFRRRETFDSASTPKLGEKRVQPKALAPVDVDALRDQLATTVEEAKANDPTELRKRIRELERDIENERRAVRTLEPLKHQEPERIVERVEVPVITDEQIAEFRAMVEQVHGVGAAWVDKAAVLQALIERVAAPRPAPVIPATRPVGAAVRPDRVRTEAPPPSAAGGPPSGASLNGSLGKAERLILAALAGYPTPLTREQLALLAGYHPRTPGFSNAVGALRTAGLLSSGWPAEITAAGRDAVLDAGLAPTSLPPLDVWMTRFGKAERLILGALLDAHPEAMPREQLAETTGYHPRTPGFSNALGKLRGVGIVEGFGLHPDFAQLIGR